jgi:hypothetical protein
MRDTSYTAEAIEAANHAKGHRWTPEGMVTGEGDS